MFGMATPWKQVLKSIPKSKGKKMSYIKIPGSHKKVVIKMDSTNFDLFVRVHLPKICECPKISGYQFAAFENAENDSTHSFDTLSEYEYYQENPEEFEVHLEQWQEGDFNHLAGEILNYLTFKGIIEPAEYVIKVEW